MGRFARVTEEILLRRNELAVEHHKTGKLGKSALETLLLYVCILTHSWATGIIEKKKFKELCETYDLNLQNSYRRLKTMRKKGWIEDTPKYIRPLLIHRPDDSKTVTVTQISSGKSVTVTPKLNEKSVTVTPEKCNSYTKTGEKSVTVTPENAETPFEQTDSGDAKTLLNLKTDFMNTTHGENADGVRVENSQNLSKFSLTECLAYTMLCQSKGDEIRNPRALAITLHKTGSADAFIEAALYPEPISEVVEQHIEYADDEYFELPPAEPLTADERQNSLALPRSMLRETTIENLESFAVNFTPTDWAWLKGELQNAR